MASSRQTLAAAAAEQTGMLLASFEVRSGRQHGSHSARRAGADGRFFILGVHLNGRVIHPYLAERSPKLDSSSVDYDYFLFPQDLRPGATP
jgi:hypothetical protein